ncbi:MAG: phytanoyl-CoA dioxygenase family protein [Paracoccaceae bacterium]
MRVLTPAQKEQFDTQGYVVIDTVLPDPVRLAVIAEYTALLDDMYDRWAAKGLVPPATGQDFWNKLLVSYEAGLDWFNPMDISLPDANITPETPCHFGPAVFDMMTNPRLLDTVEDLIGDELTSCPIQHVRLKPPAKQVRADETRPHLQTTAWHQDRAVAHESGDRTDMVTVWLAMNDATLDNGCLTVVPGKPQMYPHCPRDMQSGIAKGFLDEDAAVPLPVKAGGAVLFHPLTPHASLANTSGQFRWSFDIRYSVTGQPTGRSHFPDFVARSRANPATELRDAAQWHALWMDTRARLAQKPHIPFHRWSADAPVCA